LNVRTYTLCLFLINKKPQSYIPRELLLNPLIKGSVQRHTTPQETQEKIRDSGALIALVDPQHRGGGTQAALQSALRKTPVIHVDVRARDTRLVLPRSR
jgi:hypothetical protein